MTSSPLTETIKRTSTLLLQGASNQVTEYENRFQTLHTLYDRLLSDFIIANFDNEKAYKTAQEFFGTPTVRFAGIDGTMYSRPLFDLIIFFGGAYASTGTITFTEKNTPIVTYDAKTFQQSAGVSSVVPVYINEVPDIDQTFFDTAQPGKIALNKPLTDDGIVNNATIANWIMTFAEFYLAYKLASDPQQSTRIILMDRSLSIERASLLYETHNRDLWKTKSALIGCKIDNQPIDMNDLTIGRQHIINTTLKIPAPRADYLRYAIFNTIQQKGALTKKQILQELGIADEKRAQRTERYLKALLKDQILTEKFDAYTLNPKYADTWTRLKKLVIALGDQFFSNTEPATLPTSNLMKIQKNGKEQWLTTLDIAFLTLFSLEMLIEQCWNNNILLIGITKDTAARDFKRQLIPILQNQQMLKSTITHDELEKLPNTDRMILQSASLFNPDKMKVPWSLIEYDSAFKTMIPDPQNRKSHVLGARKNRISIEKTFLKTYIQLSQAASDPMLRSNVLLIDRLAHPKHDYTPNSTTQFWNEFGGATEPVQAILFKNNTVENPLQNLIMTTLIAMTSPSIPEAFGHNKPLFIADKIAKHNYTNFKRIADSTAHWLLNNHKLRKFIFYMSTFRERRATIEATRRETP
ncbi:MAG TPA: hypothetical protein VJ249_03915 [Candidatus Bathyarchaeia archaeon]|nr:hypothetical protein [Candidatus Bathyarchaeia archaeon]